MKDNTSEQIKQNIVNREKTRKISFGAAIALINVMFVLACDFQLHAVTATEVLAYIDTNQNGIYDTPDQELPGVYFKFDVGDDDHKGFQTDENGLIILPTIINNFSVSLEDYVTNNSSRSVTSAGFSETTDGRVAKIKIGYSPQLTTPGPQP